MDNKQHQELLADFGIQKEGLISKEALLNALAHRIRQLLEAAPEQLFSMLYRLDISERKLKESLQEDLDFAEATAQFIYERQMEKMHARRQYKSGRAPDDLAW